METLGDLKGFLVSLLGSVPGRSVSEVKTVSSRPSMSTDAFPSLWMQETVSGLWNPAALDLTTSSRKPPLI